VLLNYYVIDLNQMFSLLINIKSGHNNINLYSTNNLSKYLLVTKKENNYNIKYLQQINDMFMKKKKRKYNSHVF